MIQHNTHKGYYNYIQVYLLTKLLKQTCSCFGFQIFRLTLRLLFVCVFKCCYLSFPPREDNIPWNSNIIVERFSNYVLKTVTGKVYILVGKMNLGVDSGKSDSVWVDIFH